MSYAALAPGATVTLFHWDGDECVRDEWGCTERQPLPAGSYRLRGVFCLADADRMPDCDAGSTRGGGTASL
ncbi:MAG: hypothetical protein QOD77_1091 [Thermoplasmata archaeon]|nr:hypothetical protein [Thermoplasmata archaeon]